MKAATTHTTHVWTQSCAYNEPNKRTFHLAARQRLKQLAEALRLTPGSYDIRSNRGGPAVSGEIILHHEQLYISVDRPTYGIGMGLLYRSCNGRRDYTGGRNMMTSLLMLEDIPALARTIQRDVPLTPPHIQQ